MTTLYVLDVDDFRPLAEAASKLPGVAVAKRGPYYEVVSDASFEISRDATGCRNAVWYSSVAAVRSGRVSRWDKTALRIEPAGSGQNDEGSAATPSRGDFADKACSEDLERDVT